jgi:hypothetical protein
MREGEEKELRREEREREKKKLVFYNFRDSNFLI